MTVEELLDSPVGRRMVAVMRMTFVPQSEGDAERLTTALAAALRVALSDVCPTCRGAAIVPHINGCQDCTNPDCNDGRVTPAFVSGQHAEYLFRQGENMRKQAAIDTRAQVVEEIADWLQHIDRLDEIPGARPSLMPSLPEHNPLWDAANALREREARR